MKEKIIIYGLEPVLVVNNLKETLNYYVSTLGFSVDWVWPQDDNWDTADHASVSLGSGHKGEEEHDKGHIHIQLSSSDNKPVQNSGWLYIHISSDIDTLYDFMKSNGATISSKIADYPWGMREFDIRELNGHVFRFGKPLAITE